MKLHLILTTAALGATLGLANAQGPGGGPPGGGKGGKGGEGGKRPDPAEMAKHLSERFATIAAYDSDKNGKLDATEQGKLATDVEAGKLELGPPGGGKGGDKGGAHEKPPGKVVAEHAAKIYEALVPFDTDKSGSLSETEGAAVGAAIKDGSLKLPRPGGPGGPGHGGPGGPGGRPDGPPPQQ